MHVPPTASTNVCSLRAQESTCLTICIHLCVFTILSRISLAGPCPKPDVLYQASPATDSHGDSRPCAILLPLWGRNQAPATTKAIQITLYHVVGTLKVDCASSFCPVYRTQMQPAASCNTAAPLSIVPRSLSPTSAHAPLNLSSV